jgi:thiol-disulfide isomerase/thioredoxin
MIGLSNRLLNFAIIVPIVTAVTVHLHAEPAVIVSRIEEAALDELIQAGTNPLVLTFLAAWCEPCIDELPVLNKLHQKYNHRGLKLIGVSIDLEGPEAIQPIVNKLGIQFPLYWYGENAVPKFKLNAIPMLFFIRKGEIVERLYGKRSERFLDKKIQEFLK